ncbi:TPA: hypothetical protein DCQ85_03095 [Candidatus Magasanikbacteria bacterium]|nr:hypothetical protein [Candidatus Magasanikbacteria bacterium]
MIGAKLAGCGNNRSTKPTIIIVTTRIRCFLFIFFVHPEPAKNKDRIPACRQAGFLNKDFYSEIISVQKKLDRITGKNIISVIINLGK